jgi:hypothetical protein
VEQFGEVLGEEPTEPLTQRLWRRVRARPLVPAVIVVVVVAAAGTVVAIRTRPVEPAALAVIRYPGTWVSWSPGGHPEQYGGPDAPYWQVRPDGRPSGPPVLSTGVAVQRKAVQQKAGSTADADVVTRVVGITGPGVVRADNPPVVVPPAGLVGVPLRAVLDCGQLPETTPSGAYRLRTTARSADPRRRAGRGTVDVAALSDRWADAIRVACSTWSARAHLTITELTATVDPTRPRIAVTLTVVNTGARQGFLTAMPVTDPSIRLEGRLPVRVPARGRAEATLNVVLDRCDTVQPAGADTSLPTTDPGDSTDIFLAGRVGSVPTAAEQADLDRVEGTFQSTGVLLTPHAYRRLRAALSEACAGLNPVLPLISPGTVRYDRAGDVVTVPLQLFVAPGRVRHLRLRTEPRLIGLASAGREAYLPLWKPTGDLTPDRSGHLVVPLRYRPPRAGRCPNRGGYLPALLVTLDVPVAGGVRRLTYSAFANLFEDPAALRLLCPGSEQGP